MRNATTEMAACAICGRERRVNLSRPRQQTCASCRYLAQAVTPGEWVDQALCAQVDPELFWSDPMTGPNAKKAQQVCLGCPVIDDCLKYALDTNQSQGIWGGLTPSQRLALTRAS
jgi:WhiB family transcriptional regulator, redox-sensing transcriptional regulator